MQFDSEGLSQHRVVAVTVRHHSQKQAVQKKHRSTRMFEMPAVKPARRRQAVNAIPRGKIETQKLAVRQGARQPPVSRFRRE